MGTGESAGAAKSKKSLLGKFDLKSLMPKKEKAPAKEPTLEVSDSAD